MTGRISRLIVVAGLLAGLVTYALADGRSPRIATAVPLPGMPVFGQVLVAGQPAPGGVEIQARIGGINYAFSQTSFLGVLRTATDGRYGFGANVAQVKADDPGTPFKEGGVSGEIVQFFVGASPVVAGTATFESGAPTRVDLSVPSLPAVLAVVGVSVSPAQAIIEVGGIQQFIATASFSDGSQQNVTVSAVWASSNPAVATVSSTGLATGLGGGTVLIAATFGSVVGASTLTVSGAPADAPTGPVIVAVQVSPATASIQVGQTAQFTATARFGDGSTQNVTNGATWARSNPAVATISSTGQAGALAVGTTSIAATFQGVFGSAIVTVTAPQIIFFPPSTPTPLPEVVGAAPAIFTPTPTPTPTATPLPQVAGVIAQIAAAGTSQQQAAALQQLATGQQRAQALQGVTVAQAAIILRELTAAQVAEIFEGGDVGDVDDLLVALDVTTAANVVGNLAKTAAGQNKVAAIVTSNVLKGQAASAASVLESALQVGTLQEISAVFEQIEDNAVAGAIVNELKQVAAASAILETVPPLKAGKIMEKTNTVRLTEIVRAMPEAALNLRLSVMVPTKLFEIPIEVLFQKLVSAPTEVLAFEVLPEVDPALTLALAVQLGSTFIGPTLVGFTIPPTSGNNWGTWKSSVGPFQQILGNFAAIRDNARIDVLDLASLPQGVPNVPAGRIVNSLVKVDVSNTQPGDIKGGHVTIFVEKAWLDANEIHRWALQFNRFDERSRTWGAFTAKPVREDATRVFFTVPLPGFSIFSITGSKALPKQIFQVTGLSIDPQAPAADTEFRVRALVKNTSSETATYPANLWINDAVDDSLEVSVPAGATVPLSFTSRLSQGSYKVRVEREIATLRVGPVAPTATATRVPTATATRVPTATATAAATATAVPTATRTATPSLVPPTATPTAPPVVPPVVVTPTRTATPAPTATATLAPTASPTATRAPTASPTATLAPTATSTPVPTLIATATATATPVPPTATATAILPAPEEKGAGPLVLIIIVVVAVLAIGAGLGYYFLRRRPGPPAPPAAPEAGPTAPVPPESPSAAEARPETPTAAKPP